MDTALPKVRRGYNMAVKFCPYCHCIFLPNGYCRNGNCVLGNSKQATIKQLELIYKMMDELGIETKGRDPNKLTKESASKLIDKLIKLKLANQFNED